MITITGHLKKKHNSKFQSHLAFVAVVFCLVPGAPHCQSSVEYFHSGYHLQLSFLTWLVLSECKIHKAKYLELKVKKN